MELFHAFGLDIKLLIANLINFALLVFILYKIAYKPILKFVHDRTQRIEEGVKNAERADIALKEAEDQKQQIIVDARKSAQDIMNKSREEATKEAQMIMDTGKQEANRIIEKAQKTIQMEYDAMTRQAKQDIVSLVVLTTKTVLKDSMDATVDEQYVQKVMSQIDSKSS